MNENLQSFLDPLTKRIIDSMHQIQKNHYGVYEPPTLKQLVSLRHLLIYNGFIKDIQPEELLGLSKSECKELLKKLNSMYISSRRKDSGKNLE